MRSNCPKLVLLDRDGVINVDHQKSLLSLAEFEFIPGSVSALKKLQEAGFEMAVVTNQRCVGRGDLSPEGLEEIHAHMKQALKKEGVVLEIIFACTDHPDRPTHRMKPNPGMLEEAMAHFGADPKDTYMIGDQITDMKAAYAVGCARHLVLTGHGEKTLQNPEVKTFEPLKVHKDLSEAADYILKIHALPDYVTSLYPDSSPSVLTTRAREIIFPLSPEDKGDLETLEQKFDGEENCAGLAAPQIGISKQMIVFSAPDDPVLKKWRLDFTQTMPKTIWINPVYEGIKEEGFHVDYEGCFSVGGVAAPVQRFKKVRYRAYDPTGHLVEGTAEGFLARIIQHEIDHIHGILYVDRVEDKSLILPVEEYRRRRQAAFES